ncbi:MAG: ABC transporter substrate-binding protein [Dehalococcoidia bacterium]|nr:ABC transporter substrate-binding protein [Dehalococcoidia bacterium]
MDRENYWARLGATSAKSGGRFSRRTVLRGTALGGVGLAGAALIGCGGDDEDEPAGTAVAPPTATSPGVATAADPFGNIKRGGTMVESDTSDPSALNPYASASFTAKGIAAYVYSRFYKIAARPDANPYSVDAEPDLAESAETEDGQHWVVKLRPGLTFQNIAPVSGREITTEDVVASWERLTAEGSPSSTQVASWTSLEAVDDYTINVTLEAPSGTFVTELADTNKLFILPREAFDGGFDPATQMIGSGPWILDEYQTSVRFRFSRNPDYWDQPKPFVDHYEIAIIPEYANSLAQFRAGNLHMQGIQADDVLSLRQENQNFQWRGLLPALLSFMYFSPEDQSPDAPWRDERFRQAVSMLTDRDTLTELGYNVRALQDAGLDVSILWNNVVPAGWGIWWLDPRGSDIGQGGRFFEYNPDEARALLDASGYAGEEVPFIYANDIYGATFNRVAEAVSNYLREGGLNVSVETQAYTAQYFPQTFAGNFHGIAFGYQTPFPEVGGYFNRMFGDDPNNHGRIDDPEIRNLDELQRVELDADVRRGYIHDIQRLNAEHMYYVPNQAGAGTGWTGYQPEVRGIVQTRGYGIATEVHPNFWLDV